MEICEECGFGYDRTARGDVVDRVAAATSRMVVLLGGEATAVVRRPHPERWSALEYAAHVRDVLLTIRERMVIGLVADDPSFQPLYRDERIGLGLYASDTPSAVATELAASAAMFGRVFDAIDEEGMARPVRYGFPDPVPRTVGWMGVHAVHETEHHLADIESNLRGGAV